MSIYSRNYEHHPTAQTAVARIIRSSVNPDALPLAAFLLAQLRREGFRIVRQRASDEGSALLRFEKLYTPEPNTACWLWKGSLNRKGYGQFAFRGRACLAHRFAYEILVLGRALAPTIVLDHLCEQPSCVNPDHLQPVTSGENTRRYQITNTLARAHMAVLANAQRAAQ